MSYALTLTDDDTGAIVWSRDLSPEDDPQGQQGVIEKLAACMIDLWQGERRLRMEAEQAERQRD